MADTDKTEAPAANQPNAEPIFHLDMPIQEAMQVHPRVARYSRHSTWADVPIALWDSLRPSGRYAPATASIRMPCWKSWRACSKRSPRRRTRLTGAHISRAERRETGPRRPVSRFFHGSNRSARRGRGVSAQRRRISRAGQALQGLGRKGIFLASAHMPWRRRRRGGDATRPGSSRHDSRAAGAPARQRGPRHITGILGHGT